MKTNVSQGAREAAHNLDDLYERWKLKYEGLGKEVGWKYLDKIDMPDDFDSASKLMAILKSQIEEITARILEIKSKGNLSPLDKKHKALLNAERLYYAAAKRHVKALRHNMRLDDREEKHQRKLERIKEHAQQFSEALVCDLSGRGYNDSRYVLFNDVYQMLFDGKSEFDYGAPEYACLSTLEQYLRLYDKAFVSYLIDANRSKPEDF